MREPSPATASLEEWAGTHGVHPKTASRHDREGTTPVPRGRGDVRSHRGCPRPQGRPRGRARPGAPSRPDPDWQGAGVMAPLAAQGRVVEVDPSEVDDDPHPHEAGLGTPWEPVPMGRPRGQPREGCRLTGRSLPRRRRSKPAGQMALGACPDDDGLALLWLSQVGAGADRDERLETKTEAGACLDLGGGQSPGRAG